MSERQEVYVLENNGDGDTESLAAIKLASIDTEPKPMPSKQENMANKLCEYLAENVAWVKLLTEEQAAIIIMALINHQSGAIQLVIDRAQEQEDAKAEKNTDISQGS